MTDGNDMKDWEQEVSNLEDAWASFGYRMFCRPIDGEEGLFVEKMWVEVAKVERAFEFMKSLCKGYRGQRRNRIALQYLNEDQPEPCWGVRVA